MSDLERWLSDKVEIDQHLYQQFGKPLEREHLGEFVAIGPDGKTFLGTDDGEVLKKAIETFGSGTFAFTRVGYPTLGRWLSLNK